MTQPRKRVVDEVAPLINVMLRAEILMKAAVTYERLPTEYGFIGNCQRVKFYVQEARPRIAEELEIAPRELAGVHRSRGTPGLMNGPGEGAGIDFDLRAGSGSAAVGARPAAPRGRT